MPVEEAVLDANRLLASLPAPVRRDLGAALSLREYGFGELVYAQGTVTQQVVFPIHGVFSIVAYMDDGRGAEIATVGNEGLVGLGELLSAGQPQPHRAIAQIPGDALHARPARVQAAMRKHETFRQLVSGYSNALLAQIAQASACGRLHSIEQRCIRWLLQSHDRAGRDTFPLTQEFLGLMLGVGRQTVNATARRLQDAELIRYVRGTITIRDRPGLEAQACECYERARAQFDRLLGPAPRRR